MTIEQNVISKIGTLPQKRICIIGTMSEKFYILLAKNLMPVYAYLIQLEI